MKKREKQRESEIKRENEGKRGRVREGMRE